MAGDLPFAVQLRSSYHAVLLDAVLMRDSDGVVSNADRHSRLSRELADHLYQQMGGATLMRRLAGQMSGRKFETATADFIRLMFTELRHLRPGDWQFAVGAGVQPISEFDQYEHLKLLRQIAMQNKGFSAVLGTDYLIKPDITVARVPEPTTAINSRSLLVDEEVGRRSPIRASADRMSTLHASISCKWTIRSDRAQNARSEALNLIRNRKGKSPHILVVTGEPMPSRIASIALGTGDIDCVYHFALEELIRAVAEVGGEDSQEIMSTMVDGKRLKDIADLPFDLAL